LERLYGCRGEHLKVRNPSGCPACRSTQIPRLNGYAGRTVAAEYIEPALAAGFLDGVKHRTRTMGASSIRLGTLSVQEGQGGAAEWSAMQCAVYKAFRGEVDPRDIEPRFQSFETLEHSQRLMQREQLRVSK
jgi:hypothetical protein